MSNALFPELPGLTFDMKCNSEFNTIVHKPANGREVRGSFSAYPMWIFSLNYSHLDDQSYGDLETLHGFILQRRGRFDSFLYDYKNANTVTNGVLGTGNGSRTEWPLTRVWGGFTEPVENPNQVESITLDDEVVDTGDYTISTAGVLNFATAPVADAVIRWTGSYYFRCRFGSDVTDFTEFLSKIYRHEDFQFRGSPVEKV